MWTSQVYAHLRKTFISFTFCTFFFVRVIRFIKTESTLSFVFNYISTYNIDINLRRV